MPKYLLWYLVGGGALYWYFFMRKKKECPSCEAEALIEEFKVKVKEYKALDIKEVGQEALVKMEKELGELEDKIKDFGIDLKKLYQDAGLPMPMNLKEIDNKNN